MNWQEIFSLKFWFSAQPGPLMVTMSQILLVAFALCLAAAISFFLLARASKASTVTAKLYKKIQSLFTTLGVVGFIILFFFYQQVPFLSSRFWLLIWVLIAIVWAGFIGQFGFIEAPRRKAELKKKAELEKYLPKKKKKKS